MYLVYALIPDADAVYLMYLVYALIPDADAVYLNVPGVRSYPRRSKPVTSANTCESLRAHQCTIDVK